MPLATPCEQPAPGSRDLGAAPQLAPSPVLAAPPSETRGGSWATQRSWRLPSPRPASSATTPGTARSSAPGGPTPSAASRAATSAPGSATTGGPASTAGITPTPTPRAPTRTSRSACSRSPEPARKRGGACRTRRPACSRPMPRRSATSPPAAAGWPARPQPTTPSRSPPGADRPARLSRDLARCRRARHPGPPGAQAGRRQQDARQPTPAADAAPPPGSGSGGRPSP